MHLNFKEHCIACRGAGARSSPGAVGSTAHHCWQLLQRQRLAYAWLKHCISHYKIVKARLPCDAPGKLGLIRDTPIPPKRPQRRCAHHYQIQPPKRPCLLHVQPTIGYPPRDSRDVLKKSRSRKAVTLGADTAADCPCE